MIQINGTLLRSRADFLSAAGFLPVVSFFLTVSFLLTFPTNIMPEWKIFVKIFLGSKKTRQTMENLIYLVMKKKQMTDINLQDEKRVLL